MFYELVRVGVVARASKQVPLHHASDVCRSVTEFVGKELA